MSMNRLKPSTATWTATGSPEPRQALEYGPRGDELPAARHGQTSRARKTAFARRSGRNFLETLPIKGRKAATTRGKPINRKIKGPPLSLRCH